MTVSLSNRELFKLQKQSVSSSLEDKFWLQLKAAKLDHLFVRQYEFSPECATWDYKKAAVLGDPRPKWRWVRIEKLRKWRFDFACVEKRIAVEIDGGSFINGGHNRGAQGGRDASKRNEAAIAGWTVLKLDSNMVKEGVAIDYVRRALAAKTEQPAPPRSTI